MRERAEALFAEGKTYAQIGVELGRNRKSVKEMFKRLREGASRNSRWITFWRPEEVETLLRMKAEKKTTREIANALGREPSHIYSKIQSMQQVKGGPRHEPPSKPTVPAETERRWRERQQLSHNNLTAALCGDPLPGYSALERRA